MRVTKSQLGTNGPIHVTTKPNYANQFHGVTVFYGSPSDFAQWNFNQGYQYTW